MRPVRNNDTLNHMSNVTDISEQIIEVLAVIGRKAGDNEAEAYSFHGGDAPDVSYPDPTYCAAVDLRNERLRSSLKLAARSMHKAMNDLLDALQSLERGWGFDAPEPLEDTPQQVTKHELAEAHAYQDKRRRLGVL